MAHDLFDTLIVGAGPAGCSAASWAAQMGWRVAVVDRAAQPCATLAGLDFEQGWVLGHPHAALRELGTAYAAHARQLPGVEWWLGHALAGLSRNTAGHWQVGLGGGVALGARSLVLATGVRPARPMAYFGTDPAVAPMDAVSLTQRRSGLAPGRVLLLGGGDNALENAAWLARRGHAVTVWTHGDWRGQAQLVAALDRTPGVVQRRHTPLPTRLQAEGGGFITESASFGRETFDHAAVLFGYERDPAPWQMLAEALHTSGLAPGRPIEPAGVFVAGDVSGRGHPCVQTALAEGVAAARQVAAYLHPASMARTESATPATLNSQILQLSGLRFGANLGVLAHEREGPQPIQVDAELNLGAQPALARGADLTHVLDYRKVRQIIIDECTAEHTDLLESLLAKLCVRLMRLPGVQGVRIRVAKLEIFDDCEVAIRCEAGEW
ncbi:MAG: dihydroneopterin aldolase [Vitreoscilla sp.]|nr:dihydroneopterin aldolase [Vitreoscilla sp.]